jgi:hypothetical protein
MITNEDVPEEWTKILKLRAQLSGVLDSGVTPDVRDLKKRIRSPASKFRAQSR